RSRVPSTPPAPSSADPPPGAFARILRQAPPGRTAPASIWLSHHRAKGGGDGGLPARPPRRRRRPAALRLAQLEHREERLLGHLDAPDLLHPLLALLLLLEQLALARDVAAVAL